MVNEKHLGTMKYMATINDLKELPILLEAMVESFKAEAAAERQLMTKQWHSKTHLS